MHHLGQAERAAQVPELAGSGPLVVLGDDVPHRLLYMRLIWGLRVTPADLARAVETPNDMRNAFEARELAWLDAWRQAWTCNDLVHDLVPGESATIPDQQPAEWFTVEGPEGFEQMAYRKWQVTALPRAPRLGEREGLVARRAESASARGLSCIYVVPVEGAWAVRGKRILAVSNETFASDAALMAAADAF